MLKFLFIRLHRYMLLLPMIAVSVSLLVCTSVPRLSSAKRAVFARPFGAAFAKSLWPLVLSFQPDIRNLHMDVGWNPSKPNCRKSVVSATDIIVLSSSGIECIKGGLLRSVISVISQSVTRIRCENTAKRIEVLINVETLGDTRHIIRQSRFLQNSTRPSLNYFDIY